LILELRSCQRIVLAGGAKSYGFSLGAFNAPAKETQPRLIAPIHYHQQEDIVAEWADKNGASWTVLRPHLVMGPSLNSPMNLVTGLAAYAAITRELGLPLRFPGNKEGWNALQDTTDAELFGRATLWALAAGLFPVPSTSAASCPDHGSRRKYRRTPAH
jgi:nucleoside-diphosphate-sugar epimerase